MYNKLFFQTLKRICIVGSKPHWGVYGGQSQSGYRILYHEVQINQSNGPSDILDGGVISNAVSKVNASVTQASENQKPYIQFFKHTRGNS